MGAFKWNWHINLHTWPNTWSFHLTSFATIFEYSNNSSVKKHSSLVEKYICYEDLAAESGVNGAVSSCVPCLQSKVQLYFGTVELPWALAI
jgi:hypothetical protein